METASKVFAMERPVENPAGVHLQCSEIDIKPEFNA
mgnify:CR=1 FL=1